MSTNRIDAGRTPASIAAKLSFDRVTHRYGDVTAVRDVSLDIEPGEIVCLLGRSGCGKTTLLRLAAGVEEPAEGRILINDRAVSEGPYYLPPERRV
ncbi:MAG: ATP-binding cassette domain-containing protein, partial [Rhizobium rhizophilum]